MGKKVSGPWVDRTAYYHSVQRQEGKLIGEFTRLYQIKLTVPPMWSHLSKSEYKQLCSKLSAEGIRDAHLKRKSKASLGMRIVLSENVRKPRFTKRGARPLCRTKCIKTLKAYQKLYFEFKAKFQEVSADLRQAIRLGCDTASICFPNGGVPLFGGCYSPD